MSEVCFKVPALDKAERQAIKALRRGDADQSQQALALAVIVNKLSGANELQYVPGSQDQSAFLSGRAFVGNQIKKIINHKIED